MDKGIRIIVDVSDEEIIALEFFSKMKGSLGESMKAMLERIEYSNPKTEEGKKIEDDSIPF